MRMDRAEWAGTGAAIVFHGILIAALSLSLAHVVSTPEPPAMEVDFVDNVGLTSSTPEPSPTPPPAAQSPQVEPSPVPDQPTVVPAPKPVSNTPAIKPVQPKPPQPTPRAPRLGDDFLKGIEGGQPSSNSNAKPAAATVSASAMASIVGAIKRQVQPCADRQVNPGPGANRIQVRMHLQLLPSGRLKRPPEIIGTSGVDADNAQYEERVRDLAVATFVGCAPLTGLPPELYKTESGQGWSDFIMRYNLP